VKQSHGPEIAMGISILSLGGAMILAPVYLLLDELKLDGNIIAVALVLLIAAGVGSSFCSVILSLLERLQPAERRKASRRRAEI
jgi:hypothetical protein